MQVPFELRSSAGQAPYGEVRVTVEVGLLRADILPELKSAGFLALGAVLLSTILSAVFIRVMLAPLDAINEQLDSYTSGKFDAALARSAPPETGDEFTQVRTKITRLGEQLRGVREIFSTLRENMQQVMAGLDDGLILFTHEGRAVLVSPAVEKFLGAPADQILGRHAAEIFPPGHPLRRVLLFEGERLLPIEESEIELAGSLGYRRIAPCQRHRSRGAGHRVFRTGNFRRACDSPRFGIARTHRHRAGNIRASLGSHSHHRRSRARSEESAELHAPVAGKFERKSSAGK